jgi:hypothetical protein
VDLSINNIVTVSQVVSTLEHDYTKIWADYNFYETAAIPVRGLRGRRAPKALDFRLHSDPKHTTQSGEIGEASLGVTTEAEQRKSTGGNDFGEEELTLGW